jgi:hypothetical protein
MVLKLEQMLAYGASGSAKTYQEDHLISWQLGGGAVAERRSCHQPSNLVKISWYFAARWRMSSVKPFTVVLAGIGLSVTRAQCMHTACKHMQAVPG